MPKNTRIPAAVIPALASAPIHTRHFRVVLAILDLTHGRRRASAAISRAELARMTGLSRGSVFNVLDQLKTWGIVTSDTNGHGPGNASVLAVETKIQRWKLASPTRPIITAELASPTRPELASPTRPIPDRLNGSTPPAAWVRRGRLCPPGYTDAGLATLPLKTASKLREIGVDGFRPEWGTVAAWFAMTAPKLEARGYKSVTRAALNWWQRARADEINGAEAWVNHRRVQQGHELPLFSEDDVMREIGGDDV